GMKRQLWARPLVCCAGILFLSFVASPTAAKPLWADSVSSDTASSRVFSVDDQYQLPAGTYSDRPAGAQIDTVVVHFISAVEIDAKRPYDLNAILRLFSPNAAVGRPATSAHYLIERSGRVLQLVPEDKRAWHAGFSRMPPPDHRERV